MSIKHRHQKHEEGKKPNTSVTKEENRKANNALHDARIYTKQCLGQTKTRGETGFGSKRSHTS